MKEQSTTKNIIKYMLTSVAIYFSLFFDMSKVYPNVYLQSADSGEIVKIVSFLQRFDAGFGDYSLAEDFGLKPFFQRKRNSICNGGSRIICPIVNSG